MNKLHFSFIFILFSSFFNYLHAQTSKSDKNDLTYTYIEAIRHKTLGNLPQAAYLLKKLTELDSTCASCLFDLSKVFVEAGDVRSGLPFAAKAYFLDQSNYWYVKNYADLLRYNGEWKLAVNVYRSLVNFKESDEDDIFALAESLLNSGNSTEGLKLIEEVETKNGVSERFVLLKYRYFLNKKKYSIALNELQKLVTLNPDNAIYYGMQAEIFGLQNKTEDALNSYKKLFELKPYFSNAYNSFGKFNLSQDDTATAYKQFNFVLQDSNFTKADRINLLNSLIKEPDSKNYYSFYVETYIPSYISKNDTIAAYREFLCDYYESRNDAKNASLIAMELILRNASNFSYWDRYFYYLNVLKDFDLILSYESTVNSQLYSRPFVLFVTGLAAYFKEDPKKSIHYLKKGLDVGQNNKFLTGQMLNLIAENYYKIHKLDSSFYYYEMAISEGIDDIGMLNNYAYYLSLEGLNLDKALKMSKLTIERDPDNATYLDTYAWVLFQLKLYSEAHKYIMLAYKNDRRGSYEMMEHVGDILYCLGKKSKAIIYWNKAAEKSPERDRILHKISNYDCP